MTGSGSLVRVLVSREDMGTCALLYVAGAHAEGAGDLLERCTSRVPAGRA